MALSIKPTRTEILDMIIRQSHEELREKEREAGELYRQRQAELRDLQCERRDAAAGITAKERHRLTEDLAADLNSILAKYGLTETKCTLSSRWVSGPKVVTSVEFGPVDAKPRKPRSTAVVDRKIKAAEEAVADADTQYQLTSRLTSNFACNGQYGGQQRSVLRSQVLQAMMESDNGLMEGITKAVSKLTAGTNDSIVQRLLTKGN